MTKLLASILTLALVFTLALPAVAETAAPGTTLVVTGSSSLSLVADLATIELGAQTRGKTVAEAHQENVRIMTLVIAEMEKLGIAKEDIRTSQYYVYFEPDYSVVSTVQNLISGSFNVTNLLQVTLRDIQQVSAAIDAASKVGANNLSSLIFQSSKQDEAQLQALRNAVEDAKAKASVLAEAAGKTLGDIIKVETLDPFAMGYGGTMARDTFAAEIKSTPILSGDVTVNAAVTLTFSLK